MRILSARRHHFIKIIIRVNVDCFCLYVFGDKLAMSHSSGTSNHGVRIEAVSASSSAVHERRKRGILKARLGSNSTNTGICSIVCGDDEKQRRRIAAGF